MGKLENVEASRNSNIFASNSSDRRFTNEESRTSNTRHRLDLTRPMHGKSDPITELTRRMHCALVLGGLCRNWRVLSRLTARPRFAQ
jgi:hypothetical protein